MKKKFFIGIFIFAVIGLAVFLHLVYNHHKNVSEFQSNLQAPIEIPDTGIVEISQVKGDKPVIAMFYVNWCTYCRRFMPIFGEAAKNHGENFTFAVVNCENPENQQIIEKYNIMGFPSLFITDKDLDFEYQLPMSATVSLESFENEINKHLKLRKKLKK